jgi:hypothetical protein
MTLTPNSLIDWIKLDKDGCTITGEELLINCGGKPWVDGYDGIIQRNFTIYSFENMAGSLQLDILYESGWLDQSLLIEIFNINDQDMKVNLFARFSLTSNYLTDHHYRFCEDSIEYDFIKRYIFEVPHGFKGENFLRIYQSPDQVPMRWGLMNVNLTLVGCDMVEGLKYDSDIYTCICKNGFFRNKMELKFECLKCQDSCEICIDEKSCQTCMSKSYWNNASKSCEKIQRIIFFYIRF